MQYYLHFIFTISAQLLYFLFWNLITNCYLSSSVGDSQLLSLGMFCSTFPQSCQELRVHGVLPYTLQTGCCPVVVNHLIWTDHFLSLLSGMILDTSHSCFRGASSIQSSLFQLFLLNLVHETTATVFAGSNSQ